MFEIRLWVAVDDVKMANNLYFKSMQSYLAIPTLDLVLMGFRYTILGGWSNADYKANLSPAELRCCCHWARLSLVT